MDTPKKISLFVCLLSYIICTTIVSGSLTECENYTPKFQFLYSFLNLNNGSFVTQNQYFENAHNYFQDLLSLASLPNFAKIPTPKEYCTQTYALGNGNTCIADMAGIQAFEHVYNNQIYSQVAANIYNEKEQKKDMMVAYIEFLYGIAKNCSDTNFRTIKEFCESQNMNA